MTNSEKLLSSFSEDFFYKELVYADLKFVPEGGTEIELADLIINLEDVILAIQLKERNEKDRTQDKNVEEKWLKKKCKKAKEQIKDTILFINNEKVSFVNARGKETKINPNAEIVPLVVFENVSISEYEHLLRSHTADGLSVNCMSIDDFQLMCQELVSPIEIMEYVKWRKAFYEKNGAINLLITETKKGFFLSKPQKQETLVHQYLYEQYGDDVLAEDNSYYELFRQYVSVLYEHIEVVSEPDGCYEVVKFLAHLFRDEIRCFVERIEKALVIAKRKRFELVGTLRNSQKEYAMVFTVTEQGEQIPSEKLLSGVFEKQKVHTLLQIMTYYSLGRWIVETQQMGEKRAKYGSKVIKTLSEKLQKEFGKGFSEDTLKNARKFYLTYKERISETVFSLFAVEKSGTVFSFFEKEPPFIVSWSHYLQLMSIENETERSFYEIETAKAGWGVRTLQRQYNSSLYERLALSRDKEGVLRLATEGNVIAKPEDIIKQPTVLEFLGMEEKAKYSETDLETALINKLQKFLLELGKGYLFEARQKRFTYDEDNFYVDLVFYNRLLRCYVLIDLKVDKLTHQDIGQMQMYVNYYDRYEKLEDENPTIGILLCKEKNDALVEITLPKDANIYASE